MNWKLAAAAWSIFIVALCSIPGTSLPSTGLLEIDKLAHFTLFAVFAWLWLQSTDRPTLGRIVVVIVAGALFGAAIEYYQGLLPFGRQPSVGDAVADTAGLVAGAGLYFYEARRQTKTA